MTEPLADDVRVKLRAGGGYLESAIPRAKHRVEDPEPEPQEYTTGPACVPPTAVPDGARPAPKPLPLRKPPAPAEPLAEVLAPLHEPGALPLVGGPATDPQAPEPPDALDVPPRQALRRVPTRESSSPKEDFYSSGTGRATFNPGNANPFHGPRTAAGPRRGGRNPVRTVVTWSAVLVVLAIGGKYGYPVLTDQLHAKEIKAVESDLKTVATSEDAYQRLYGGYSGDMSMLGVSGVVNHVEITSATSASYCLRATSRTGGIVRYFSPGHGVSETPCA